jgi:PilZ domain
MIEVGPLQSSEITLIRDPILTHFIMAIAFALLVSADPATVQQFSLALRELCISPEICQEAADAVRLLNRRKFDAVVVDLQLGQQCGLILDGLKLSSSNRTAVTFAISSSDGDATTAFRRRTAFVFERPLSPQSIRNTLKPAYGLILRERRRYFRCSISNPVTILRRNMPDVSCRSVNISEGGMAVSAVVVFNIGEDVQVQFSLPDHKEPVLARSTICWLETGHFGIRFVSLPLERKSELQAWLSRKLEEAIPESVARQFQKAGTCSTTVLAIKRLGTR